MVREEGVVHLCVPMKTLQSPCHINLTVCSDVQYVFFFSVSVKKHQFYKELNGKI